MKNKEKIPSSFSLMNWLKPIYCEGYKYINLSEKSCGPTDTNNFDKFLGTFNSDKYKSNRTRDFRVSTKHFTIKLLAHNSKNTLLNYLNLFNKQNEQ